MFAKKFALDEAIEALERERVDLDIAADHALPLDNLDDNIRCADAIFAEWPRVEAIVGNPPFQSKNKLQQELGRAYVNRIRARYPDMPGRADFCVYFFRKAHDHLLPGQRAGLVGTNTIRQNYSRQGGLDHIVSHGGTIIEAVSSQAWSGDAAVHVSLVSWVNGPQDGLKRLSREVGDGGRAEWEAIEVAEIDSALSFGVDVTGAATLRSSAIAPVCFQGQTHGHKGFLLTTDEAAAELTAHPRSREVLFPFLTADELLGNRSSLPDRFVIDFADRSQLEARGYRSLFDRIERMVLPEKRARVKRELSRNSEAVEADPDGAIATDHAQSLNIWWQLFRRRPHMLKAMAPIHRYIACGRVTKRPIFEFIATRIHPNDALQVFTLEDDYSFGILQSNAHWVWFVARCSTLKGDYRYTSNSVFDTFPWPQAPSRKAALAVATAARALRNVRRDLRSRHRLSLRDLYRTAEGPGAHPLKDAHANLDASVASAYRMKPGVDLLSFLAALNVAVADAEARGEPVTGPGLPVEFSGDAKFASDDCLSMPPGGAAGDTP